MIDHGEGNQLDVVASAESEMPNEPYATRLPSTRISVSFGSKPRRLNCTVPSPPLPMFWLTVPPASAG